MLIAFLTFNLETFGQVGIGTLTPHASSMLDVTSTTKGMLAPRMTTAQKAAIATPETGLLVYDTDLGKFCYYNGSVWIILEANIGRDNYVLVKSIADLPAAVSGVITLAAGTLYEINGTIALGANSINSNGATITGQDVDFDRLEYTGSGTLFTGANGGLVEFVSLVGNSSNTLFGLNDATKTKNFILRDCYVLNFGSLGTISGHFMVFFDTIGYLGNQNGITYADNHHLFVNYVLWFETNIGTYAKLTGTFHLVSFLGGEIVADAGETGIDVSATPTITDYAVINNIAITGSGTRKLGTFSKQWEVESAGINTEKDDVATGTFYISTSAANSFASTGAVYKVSGTTTALNLFRFDTGDTPTNNRLRYMGTKTRKFIITGSYSVLSSSSTDANYSLYVAKTNVVDIATKSPLRTLNNLDRMAGAISGSIELAPGDYIEIGIANETNLLNCTVLNMNIVIR